MYEEITAQAKQAVTELLDVAGLKAGDLFVVGCSSSEVVGARIGKGSSMEAAQAVFDGIYPVLHERGIYLAAQCCEHLNRALILETEAAEKFGYDIVNVRPWAHDRRGRADLRAHKAALHRRRTREISGRAEVKK